MTGRERRWSLRWLILAPLLLTAATGLALFGVYVDRVDQRNRLADVDQELVRAQASAASRFENFRPGGPFQIPPSDPEDQSGNRNFPDGVEPPVQLLLDVDGNALWHGSRSNPFSASTLRKLVRRDGASSVADGNYRVRVSGRRDGELFLVTALPLDSIDQARRDFRRALVAAGLAISALQAIVVWLVTSRIVRPVAEMTTTAGRIADGELEMKIGPPSGSRETANLAGDLDRMLTRLRSAMAESEQSAVAAHQARDDMERFLADASHELRTPLTALRGYSDLYGQNMLDEPGALDRAMSRIGSESERLSGLVDTMLQLADRGSIEHVTAPVDVLSLVHDVVLDLRAAHPHRTIELDVDPTSDYRILGAPDEVHQAVLNLGSNACQHTPPDSMIRFDVRGTSSAVVVDVVDHGPGIADDDLDKVFLPFFRADPSRGRNNGGAGLGLTLTKRIAQRHRGSVAVLPTPGGGVTFRLTLDRSATSSG